MKVGDSLLLFIAYVATARLGIEFTTLSVSNIAVIWLPSGIAVIGLILYGYRALVAILLGAFVATAPELLQIESIHHLVFEAIIHTAQPAIAYAFYKWLNPNGALFDMPTFMTFFVGVSVLPPMLTAWSLIVNLNLGGFIDLNGALEWKTQIYNITSAHALGIFLLVPLFEATRNFKWRHLQRTDLIRFGYMMVFLGFVFYWLFYRNIGYPMALILPMTAVALTGGIVGASIAYVIVSVTSIGMTLNDVGPFVVSMSATSAYGLIYVMIGLGIPSFLIAITTHNSQKLTIDLEKRVKERTKELAELNRNKDHLMSIIAHDLRNPIQGIIGLSDLMKQDVKTKDYSEISTYSDMIHGSSKQVLQLLYNLLDWSATQSGLMRFSPKWVDLDILIQEVFAYYKEMAASKSIRLYTDIPTQYQAYVDTKMMATILRNLTSNALKFTPEGGTVQIKVTSLETNGFRLSVSDTGVGMTANQQANLFRMDESSQTNRGTNGEVGSGLGLMLCKTFIDKHNGHLSIYSEPGKGSEFHLTFPGIHPVT